MRNLPALLLKLEKSTTKNGHPVWNLSGETRAYKEAIKKAKGIWYGPRRLWSFYGTDDPADTIAKAIEDTYQHPSMVPWLHQQAKQERQAQAPDTTQVPMDKDEVDWFTNSLPLDIDTLEKKMADQLGDIKRIETQIETKKNSLGQELTMEQLGVRKKALVKANQQYKIMQDKHAFMKELAANKKESKADPSQQVAEWVDGEAGGGNIHYAGGFVGGSQKGVRGNHRRRCFYMERRF